MASDNQVNFRLPPESLKKLDHLVGACGTGASRGTVAKQLLVERLDDAAWQSLQKELRSLRQQVAQLRDQLAALVTNGAATSNTDLHSLREDLATAVVALLVQSGCDHDKATDWAEKNLFHTD